MAFMDKPIVVGKIRNFMCALKTNDNKIEKIPKAITVNINNLCNFKCSFCFSADSNHELSKQYLPLKTVKEVSNQAHALGIWKTVLTGGEQIIKKRSIIKYLKTFQLENLS